MIIYLSSYPRSGNSLMQNLIGNFFARPITGVELTNKLIRTKATKNWHYNDRPLTESHEEIQLLAFKLNQQLISRWNKYIFRKYDLNQWIIKYDLDVPPYTKNCACLLPGCRNILTPKNRQKLATDSNYFFIKTHGFPFPQYFQNEYVIQIIRHPSLVFESYFHYLKKYSDQNKTLNNVIAGEVFCGSWSKWHQDWEQAMSVSPDQFLRLRFEDILSDTLKACEQIKALINLNYDSAQKLVSFEDLHKRSPNYFRSGKTKTKQLIYSQDQLDVIQKLHGITLAQFGYEVGQH